MVHQRINLASALVLLLVTSSVTGQQDIACPVGTLSMAGADGARRVVEAWKASYATICPDLDITTDGGGYAAGAARVCGNHILYSNVDMAGMAGPFFSPQATTKNGWRFDCKKSDRKAVLVSDFTHDVWVDVFLSMSYSQKFRSISVECGQRGCEFGRGFQ